MSYYDPARTPSGAPERPAFPAFPASPASTVAPPVSPTVGLTGAQAPSRPARAVSPDPARDLVARDLVMTYGRSGASAGPPALGGVDLTIRAGESLAVMGPSGSGKTTLLHVLAGILRPTGGQVLWRGRDIARMSDRERTVLRREDFGFVFQQGMLLPELPAIENVALPLMLGGVRRSEATARAATLFHPLGLSGLEKRRPGELSGGQAQRVAIARALVARPGVVFADEPTGALDQTTSAEVMHHLTQLAAHTGASLVVVTHDENVARWCHGVVRVRDGRIAGADAGAHVAAGPVQTATAVAR
ncbi:ABC transporter ATP-binding protein [Terrabacter sp. 2TAF16]|uniref:ABC transporter ATP-binding protein n=1 Tax=unclassified Terrabacter TaxID=2630222 RepID=UPI003F9E11C9